MRPLREVSLALTRSASVLTVVSWKHTAHVRSCRCVRTKFKSQAHLDVTQQMLHTDLLRLLRTDLAREMLERPPCWCSVLEGEAHQEKHISKSMTVMHRFG